ncbi:MAG: hypothetical protein ACYTFZ_02635 [Planctomycetota bacterium]
MADHDSSGSLKALPDEQLWGGFVGGEDGALDILVGRYREELHWYLVLSTGRQDVAARSFQAVWSLLASYRCPFEEFASFRSWLYAAATQNAAPPTHPERFGLADFVDDLRRVEPKERRGKLFFAIRDLKQALRQPLLLVTLAGLSVPEAAKACNFTVERTWRCLEKAYQGLAQAGLFGPAGRRRPCRAATRQVVRALLVPAEGTVEREVAGHLQLCPDCAQRASTYQRIRDDVQGLAPVEMPEELAELAEEAVRQALAAPEAPKRPPACAKPERPHWEKVLMSLGALGALVLLAIGLLAAFPGKGRRIESAGEIILCEGKVEMKAPGASKWHTIGPREFLTEGALLRTDPGSLLKVRGDGVEWWLAGMSSIALGDSRTAELLAGRAYIRCDGTAESATRLASANGSVSCSQGEFTATVSLKRLRVSCISGTVAMGGELRPEQLLPGQNAMLVEGERSGPVRQARKAEVTHWLGSFESYEGRRLLPRHLAVVPLAPDVPALPEEIAVDELRVRVLLSGPVALIELSAAIRNKGSRPWRGLLSTGGLILPVPLAEARSDEVEVEPGQKRELRVAALSLLRLRDKYYGLGLNLFAWTEGEVGKLTLEVNATAEGGVREFDCPTLDHRLKKPGEVQWVRHVEQFDPKTPIVWELAFAEREGVDALCLDTATGREVLVAWRPNPASDEWLKEGRSVFVAFDAAGDFGAGGRTCAHEVLEGLLGFLPSGSSTALLAYDGTVKLDPDRLMQHFPVRMELMLESLWGLQDGKLPGGPGFLRRAIELVAAGKDERLLVLVAGRHPEVEETLRALQVPPNLRIATLQVGEGAPADAYRELCARTGGVAVALPESQSPDLAVFDFLSNLRWPAVRQAAVRIEGAEPVTANGDFASQPVAALVPVSRARRGATGRFKADLGDNRLARDFSLQQPRVLDGPTAEQLARALEDRLRPQDPALRRSWQDL